MIKRLLRRHALTIAGIIIGGVAGYFYYDYTSCASGTCPITARPLNTIIYGAVMGALSLNIFERDKKTI